MSNLAVMTEQEQKLAERVNTDTTRSLAISNGAGGLAFANANEAMEFAKLMALSQVAVPRHLRANPGACLAVVIQSIEWRMSPYAVANKSYSVNDRLAYESQLVQAVILQRAPIKGRFRFTFTGEGQNRRCRVEVTTTDGEVVDYESPLIADIPVKNSPLWKGDPDQQLTYYSGRALCRRHFPDVLLGVYTRDEIEDEERGPEQARDITPPRVAANAPLADRLTAIKDRHPSSASDEVSTGAASSPAAPATDPEDQQQDDQTPGAASGSSSQDDDFPGDRPSREQMVAGAYERGAADHAAGRKRRAVPGEFRDDDELAASWENGFDDAARQAGAA